MVATETGVWLTDDLDNTDPTWVPAVTGMANVRVDMLQIRKADNTVLAASHGRGLFTAVYDISTGIGELKVPQATIFPNPSSGLFNLKMNVGRGGVVETSVTSLSGQTVLRESRSVSGGEINLRFDISGEKPGTYLVTVKDHGRIISSSKIIKID
jgi:hypothetical protein